MTLTIWIIFIASFLYLCKLFSKREGYYSTIAVFGIGCYLYYVGVPIELAWIDDLYIGKTDLGYLTVTQINLIIMLGIIALWSFALGYRLSGYSPYNDTTKTRIQSSVPISYIMLAAISVLALLAFFSGELFAVGTYAGSYSTAYKNPLFTLLCLFSTAPLAIIAAMQLANKDRKKRLLGHVIVIGLLLWGIFSSDKDPILIAVLAWGIGLVGLKSKKIFILVVIIFGAALLLFAFVLFSIYRGGGDLYDLQHIFKLIGLRYLDPAGPMLSIADTLNSSDSLRYGSTYLDTFKLLIPRFLWADRPPDLAEAYAISKMANWTEGKGYGFSPMAEALMNFSFAGVFIQYAAYGLLWGLFWKTLRRVLWHFDVALWSSFYCILGYYLLIIYHRSHVAGSVKLMLQLVIVLSLVTLFFDQALHRNNRYQSGSLISSLDASSSV